MNEEMVKRKSKRKQHDVKIKATSRHENLTLNQHKKKMERK